MKPLSKQKHRARRLCVILLAAVLSYVAISVAGSVVVFNIIFARTDTVCDFELTYSDIDQAQYPRREFYFDSEGTSLFGCVYTPKGESRGVVLVSNGMHSCIDRHLPETMFFVDNGWSVMSFENTGVGKSGGSSTVGISQARIDALSAVAFLKEDKELCGLPVVLYGHSLGGYAVAAALEDNPDVCAVVSLAAFNSPNENMLYSARERVGFLADLQYPFMCLQNFLRFGDKSDEAAVDAINSTDTPVMIVSGNSDDIVPYELSIAQRAEEITNPNAVFVCVDAPFRGEHSTLWLSQDAARYVTETDNPTDKQRANRLDTAFMTQVLAFINAAV